MTASGAFIAIDWGTTNRRAVVVEADGSISDAVIDSLGVLSLDREAFPSEIERLRTRLGSLPVLAAGMVGSTRGWQDVPYVDAPCGLADLADALVEVAPGVRIVPGVALRGPRPDVMRGEEVQALGAVVAGMSARDALMCQPGTHDKWIEVAGGRIVDFTTAMTGELFGLLRAHGTLAGMLDGPVADGQAFRFGLERGRSGGDLLVALFEVRASVLLGRLDPGDAASYASGVLIGADVGAVPGLSGRRVALLASGPLSELYSAAIKVAGGTPETVDAGIAFAAAMRWIMEKAR